MSPTDILHELIDVVSGKQAHLSAARADELHEELTPGYTAVPPSEEAMAQARAVMAAYEASQAQAAPEQPAEPAGV